MSITRTILAGCFVLLAVSTAVAQTGGITVAVLDEDGQPLPGATVTISNELGYVKTTSSLTDKRGIVEFPVLRPGDGYAIQVAFPGYSPLRREELHVRLSQKLPVTLQMFEEYQEVVRVKATTPTIEIDKASSSTRFTDDFISDLPVPGSFNTSVMEMAPEVQDADGDGNPNDHGSA